jgi:hypothetical protein
LVETKGIKQRKTSLSNELRKNCCMQHNEMISIELKFLDINVGTYSPTVPVKGYSHL